MHSLSSFWCGALAAVLLLGCGSDDPDTKPDSGELRGLDLSKFDQTVETFLASQQLPGATAVVVHKDHGLVHQRGYGTFAADRASVIASSSKILSVGVLMRLADQKLLDIDAPIDTYLSDWGSHKPGVTVASLVSNSSGLPSLTENPVYGPYLCQYTSLTGTLQDCARQIYTAADQADVRPPDTSFSYGGGAWQLAGGIAEVVSEKSWAELVDETYAAPCDAPSLGYANHFAQGGLTGALAYPSYVMGDPSALTPTDNPNIEGGAYINAEDYGKILLMHLRGGRCGDERVLSAAAVARMQEDRIAKVYEGSTPQPELAGYGLGWWVDRADPGVVVDPGAFGAVAWLDTMRGHGAFIILESTSLHGGMLQERARPVLASAFDALAKTSDK